MQHSADHKLAADCGLDECMQLRGITRLAEPLFAVDTPRICAGGILMHQRKTAVTQPLTFAILVLSDLLLDRVVCRAGEQAR